MVAKKYAAAQSIYLSAKEAGLNAAKTVDAVKTAMTPEVEQQLAEVASSGSMWTARSRPRKHSRLSRSVTGRWIQSGSPQHCSRPGPHSTTTLRARETDSPWSPRFSTRGDRGAVTADSDSPAHRMEIAGSTL